MAETDRHQLLNNDNNFNSKWCKNKQATLDLQKATVNCDAKHLLLQFLNLHDVRKMCSLSYLQSLNFASSSCLNYNDVFTIWCFCASNPAFTVNVFYPLHIITRNFVLAFLKFQKLHHFKIVSTLLFRGFLFLNS